MSIPFVDPIQQVITQEVFGCLKKRCQILKHFKKNFIDLEEKRKEFEERRGEVEEQVKRAEEQGHIIRKKVSEWMVDVEKTKKEVDDLMQEKIEWERIRCFRFSFTNYISRYRLSKRAEQNMTTVQKKISDGIFLTVSDPAPPPPELQLPPTIMEYKVFDSREAVLNDIKDALKQNNVVGIHGAGGVGKTTMAAEVAKQLHNQGNIHEFAMAVVSQDPDVKRIQGKLASSLKDFELDETKNKEERAKKLWNRLKNGKNNLVVLDDLWGKINLREIGIPVSGGNNDCKLLITSRQPQEVWKDKSWDSKLHVKLIPIKQLKDKEAWALFKNHAGDSIESSELLPIASQVCEKCGGLPVAIRAVGEALKDKDLNEWKDALNKLDKSMIGGIVGIDEEFFLSLKLSYKMLKSEEARKCFLLCCLFPEDTEIPIEELVMHCKAARFVEEDTMEETRFRVHTLIKHLKERCLLLDVAGQENSVKVHDVIRDVGISVSKEDDKSLHLMHGFQEFRGGEGASSSEKKNRRRPYIAMWLRKSHFDDDHVCPDVSTLVLQWSHSSVEDDHTIFLRANKFLSRTILSLKVLVLYGSSISSLFPSSSAPGANLANLRLLCVDTWKEDDKHVLQRLPKLEVFRLPKWRSYDSSARVVELPAEIGLLTGLLVLDLGYALYIEKIPYGILSKLTRLEELHLPPRFSGWENGEDNRRENASIDELGCLKRLTTLRANFPNCDLTWANDIFFDKLNRFDISVGYEKTCFSERFTKVLALDRVSTANKFYGLISRVEELLFTSVYGFTGAVHGISHGFPYLKKLDIRDCNDLNYLFSEPCARALRQLRSIEVARCESLVSIVEGTDEEILEHDHDEIIWFDRLERLELLLLPNLVGFCSGVKNCTAAADEETSVFFTCKVACPVLERLSFTEVPKIESIWDERSNKNFQNLKELRIGRCERIKSIVSNQGKEELEGPSVLFPALWYLRLDCLVNVKRFYTMRCSPKEKSFFNHQVACPALEQLTFEKLPEIENIWDERSYKNFQYLKEVRIDHCEKIESIVSNLGKEEMKRFQSLVIFPSLRSVWLGHLNNMKRFYTIRPLPREESFYNHQIVYAALERFCFVKIPKATEVFKTSILPQLVGQETKEKCQPENDFQGVSLPALVELFLFDENMEMPVEMYPTAAEHGITARINGKQLERCDKSLFQPLFDALFGFGWE